jgi:two-component system cell cycle response regulator CtrA
MRVLIVTDDATTASLLEMGLKLEGFAVSHAPDGEEGLDCTLRYAYDAVVLDLMLQGHLCGPEVLRAIRKAKDTTPIVAYGYDSLSENIAALALGADYYVPKPINRDLLVVALRTVVRRSKGHATDQLTFGDLTVDLSRKRATVGRLTIPLTGKEFRLLEVLALNAGRTVTKATLLDNMYGGLDEPELKIIDVFVCKIRHKLRGHGLGPMIETIWGRGYTLPKAVEAEGVAA